MPVGSITLVVVAVLVFFGVLHRVLDRLGLTDRGALLWIAAIIVGSYIDIPLVRGNQELVVNVGGGLVPLALGGYIFWHADSGLERRRAAVAIVLTTAAMYALGSILPREPTDMAFMDPLYIFAIVAGVIAYLLGRSRRSAFVAGMLGIVLLDIVHYLVTIASGVRGRAWIGGAGAFDATIIAGVVAVLVAELVGETREHLAGGSEEARALARPEAEHEPSRGERGPVE